MQYFLIDIDGCITNGKNQDINLSLFKILRDYLVDNNISYSLCTGRPAGYVEAFAQFLSLDAWCICENGAYIYRTKTEKIIYNKKITDRSLQQIKIIKDLLKSDCKNNIKLELGKEICISVNPINKDIVSTYNKIAEEILKNYDSVYINYSTTAIDITPASVNKKTGLFTLLDYIKLPNSTSLIGIGDASGDIPFLEECHYTGCPNNSSDAIKAMVNYISDFEYTDGVLDIIKFFIQRSY